MEEKVLYSKVFRRANYDETMVYCDDKELLNTLETCLEESSMAISVIDRLERALQIMKAKERGNK